MIIKRLFLVFLFATALFTNAVAKDVSAYLIGSYMKADAVKAKLVESGFEVVASYPSVKKGTTIVFTNEALKAEGKKEGHAHAAILRIFIDDKEKMISITNPLYFGDAFMQNDYEEGIFQVQYDTLNKSFPSLSASVDKLDSSDLPSYNFMFGMPQYEDSDELSKGTQSSLLTKAREYKKGKLLIFELKLSETSTLLGYDLGKRTKKFVKKIGRANGAVLPYCISVEKGKATSLEAKYYLALSYPLLTMTKFTTIATVPGAIKKDLAKPFKK